MEVEGLEIGGKKRDWGNHMNHSTPWNMKKRKDPRDRTWQQRKNRKERRKAWRWRQRHICILGWLHEARGEQDGIELKTDTWEMGHLLNITEGIHIDKQDMPIVKAKQRLARHVEHLSQAMK